VTLSSSVGSTGAAGSLRVTVPGGGGRIVGLEDVAGAALIDLEVVGFAVVYGGPSISAIRSYGAMRVDLGLGGALVLLGDMVTCG
jgi:hypothetical protein